MKQRLWNVRKQKTIQTHDIQRFACLVFALLPLASAGNRLKNRLLSLFAEAVEAKSNH